MYTYFVVTLLLSTYQGPNIIRNELFFYFVRSREGDLNIGIWDVARVNVEHRRWRPQRSVVAGNSRRRLAKLGGRRAVE